MINKLEVGERISRLRKKEGYSQAEFSELLNVTPQAVSKWETGVSLTVLLISVQEKFRENNGL